MLAPHEPWAGWGDIVGGTWLGNLSRVGGNSVGGWVGPLLSILEIGGNY